MGADQAVVGTMKYAGPIIDDAHFEHFIGGIHTPFTFIDEFHGFIGSFAFRQDSTGLFSMQIQDATFDLDGNPVDNCRGDCTICGLSGWCHSYCYHDEYIVGIDINLGTYDEDSCAKCDECCRFGCTAPGEFCGNCPATDCSEPWCGDRFHHACNPHCVGDDYMCNTVCEHADTCHQNCCDSTTCEDSVCRLDCPEVDECSHECREKAGYFDCPPDYSEPTEPDSDEPDSDYDLAKSLYSFHTDNPLTFTAASDDCVARGGLMASTLDEIENEVLYDAIGPIGWIGLTDVDEEMTFVWVDGSPDTYRNWAPNEPNNWDENEHCVIYWGGSQWNDYDCGE